jgi:hypothetical protein
MKHLDSSRFAVDIIKMTEKEAKKSVNKGTVSAYVIIPEGFVDSIMTGENEQITLVTADSSEDIMTKLVYEFMDEISHYLIETQNSITGLENYMREAGEEEEITGAIDDINILYVNLIMNRDDLFEIKTVRNDSGAVSSLAGIICGLMVFMLMLFPLAYCPLYVRRSVTLNEFLSSRGIGIISQVLCEYFSYLVMALLCLLPLISLIVYVIHASGLEVIEWKAGFFEDYMYFVLGFIPLLIMFSALQYMLFLVCDNYISGIGIQFVCAVILGYLGGCFYPLSFFPEAVRDLAPFQPAGLSVKYLGDILLANESGGILLAVFAYAVLFLVLSVLILGGRMRYEK